MQLSLLTFNIAHGRGMSFYQGFSSERQIRRNLNKIADLLNTEEIDIAALQEVDIDSHWNKNIDLLENIRRLGGYPFAEIGIHNKRGGPKPLSYGNAVVSRFPVKHIQSNSFGDATLGEKGFLYLEFDVHGHHLPLINLHLDFRSKKRRLAQIEQVIDYIANNIAPMAHNSPIICGDFNTSDQHYGDAVEHLFHSVSKHGGYNIYPENTRTFPSHFPSKCIDFVLLPKRYQMIHCQVVKSYTSDHRPVLLKFEI